MFNETTGCGSLRERPCVGVMIIIITICGQPLNYTSNPNIDTERGRTHTHARTHPTQSILNQSHGSTPTVSLALLT